MTQPDNLLQQLAQLPRADLDGSAAEKLRQRALARFTAHAAERVAASRSSLWLRWLETSLVAAFVASYTWWTVGTIAQLRDGHLCRAEHFARFEYERRTQP